MATPKILLKRSNVAGSVPSSLDSGEFALNTADGKIYYTGHDGNIHAFLDSAGVNTLIENSVATIDSAQVIQLIDSDYVQARQLTYTIPTLGNDFVDSAQVQSIINAAYVKNIVDSAYVASIVETDGDITITITNEITSTVDSAYVNERVNTANFLDSAEAINIVDSSYVRLRADSAYIKSVTGIDADTLDGEHGTHYLDYNNFTNTPTILDNVDIENQIDSDYVRARQITYNTSDFTDSDYVEDRIDSAINALIGGAPEALNTLNELAEALGDDSDAYNTLLSQIGALPDSAEVKLIIDSAYIQLRQIKYLDSDLVKAISLDSSEIPSVVTQQYVRDRQDFRFDQLIGAPTSLSDFANDLFTSTDDLGEGSTNLYYTTARTESDATALVDSAYVQARQITYTIPSLGNDFVDSAEALKLIDANALDSGRATALIDSAYVRARQLNFDNLLDSAEVTALVDSDYVQARQITYTLPVLGTDFVDSAEALKLIDANALDSARATSLINSDYVQARQITYTLPVLGTDFVDSDQVEAIVDSAYVQLRQTAQDFAYSSLTDAPTIPAFGTDYVDSAFVTNLPVSTFTNDANYLDSTTVLPLIPNLGTNFIDSAEALKLIDANALDSGRATSLVDSAYVQLRQTAQDFSYASLTGTPTNVSTFTNDAGYLTNATTTSLIDSAYVKQRVNTNQDLATTDSVTFSGLTVSGNLNVTGTTYQVNTIAYTINDPLIHLADSNENSDVVDIGFIGHYYGNAQRRHTGVFRDASNEEFYIFNNMVDSSFDSVSPPNTINRSATGFQLATLNVGAIYGQYQGFDSDFNQKSTSDLSEGSNLYYTKARADSDIAASLNDSGNTVNITINNTIEDKVDSAYVLARVNEAPFLDSVYTTALVDSAYVQLRQDYAYGSLTGTPTIPAFGTDYVDSAFVTSQLPVLGTDFIDSAEALKLIDANALDSNRAISLIDSAHIAARQAIVDHVDVDFSSSSSTQDTTGALSNTLTGDGFGAIATGTTQTYFNGTDASFFTLTGENSTTVGNTLTEILSGLSHRVDSDTFTFDQADSEAFYVKSDAGGYTYIYPTTTSGVYDDGKKLRLVNAGTYLTLRTTGVGGETSDRFARVQTGSWPPSFGTNFEAITEAGFLNINTLAITSTVTISNTPGTGYYLKYDGSNWVDQDLDSAIDSAYVQARQDFAYGSLTGTPTIPAFGTDYVDSAFVTGQNVSTFANDANYLDSTTVTGVIDSAYINLKAPSLEYVAINSTGALPTAQTDGAIAIGSKATTNSTRHGIPAGGNRAIAIGDSAEAIGHDAIAIGTNATTGSDGYYIEGVAIGKNATIEGGNRGTAVGGNSKATLQAAAFGHGADARGDYSVALGNQTTIDSSHNNSVAIGRLAVTSAANQLMLGDDDDAVSGFTSIRVGNRSYEPSDDYDLATKLYVDSQIASSTLSLGTDFIDSAEALILIDANALDSGRAITLIDSAYIQARQSAGTDSAATIALINANALDSGRAISLIDSAYVQARTTAGTDSAAILQLIDSSYVSNRLDSSYINNVSLQQVTYVYTADSGQTAFTGADDNGLTLATASNARVSLNGILLLNTVDYTRVGDTVTLTVGADSGDILTVEKFTGRDAALDSSLINNVDISFTQYVYTADSGDTTFSGADDNGLTLAYSPSRVRVHINGILQVDSADYTASNGTSVTLIEEANAGDVIQIEKFVGRDVGLDSAEVKLIIDSAYIQARTSAGTDSATVIQLIDANALDSDRVKGVIDSAYINAAVGVANDSASTTLIIQDVVDSAYVQLRQDFAYGSLTGTPTIPAFGTDYIDSATVVDIIASEGLDSDLVINLVDSAYIQLRDRFQDSSGVTAIVDSSYIELRRPPEAIFNVVNNGASAYTFTGDGFSSSDDNPTIYLQRGLTYKFSVNASGHPFEIRVSNGGAAYSTGVTNNAAETGTVLFTPDMSAPNSLVYQCTNHSVMVGDIVILDNSSFLDSSTVTDVIDASYINGLTIDADTLGGQNSAYHLNYDNFTNTPTLPVLGTDFVDSAQVQLIVDSAYVAARSAGGGTDSAATIALIEATVDSAYVQLREGDGGGGGSQNVFQNIHVSGQDSIVADGTSDILTFEAGHGIDITTDANTDTVTIAYGLEEDHLDSADVRNIIDTELQDGNTIKRNVFTYEADSGDTTFSGADVNSQVLNVVPDNTIVFVNGILMLETTDYTLTSSTLTMTEAVDSGYSVTIIENVGKSETLLYTEAKYEYTLDSGTTYVTGADNDSVTLVLNTTTDNIDVFMNGILLSETADYTIDSSSITLIDDADSADLLTIVTRRGDVVTPAINAFEYTADSGQTTFTGSDDNSATLKYSSGAIQVHVNGILLRETDYTATNGTSVVLTEAADSGDDILISAFSAPAKFSQWTEVTATQAVASNTKNIIDCSSASVTVTFPAAPDLGDEIRIIDGTGSAATNNIIINRNGNKIQGATDNFTIDVNRAAVGFVYYNAAQGWILIEN